MNQCLSFAYQLISDAEQLRQFVEHIRHEEFIAVDLEADSMFHYQEKVCLVQMAGNGHNVVIDPLEVNDLSALRPLFADEKVCKIFHGSDYDIRSLYRDFSIEIHNLFDTQLASMFMGETETSLGAVVNRRFGIKLDKRYQKKDWSQRPLSEGMVDYAASDVFHLIPIAKALMQELHEKGRLEWVQEECQHLSEVRPVENGDDPLFLRFRGAGRLERRNLAALEGLLQFRRKLAMKKDRPLFKVFSNTTLFKIASDLLDTPAKMEASHCLSARQLASHGEAFSAIVKKAKAIPANELPIYPRKRRPRVSPKVPDRTKAIKDWRDKVAEELALDPALLFNKALITAIAIKKPASIDQLREVDGIRNWQVNSFGQAIIEVLAPIP